MCKRQLLPLARKGQRLLANLICRAPVVCRWAMALPRRPVTSGAAVETLLTPGKLLNIIVVKARCGRYST